MNTRSLFTALAIATLMFTGWATDKTEINELPIHDGKGRLVIDVTLPGATGDKDKLIFATRLEQTVTVGLTKATNVINGTLEILNGKAKELPLRIDGAGEILSVTGADLMDWSVRRETDRSRTLVLRPRQGDKPVMKLAVTIIAEQELAGGNSNIAPLALMPPEAALLDGFLKVKSAAGLTVRTISSQGLVRINVAALPQPMREAIEAGEVEPLAYRFGGAPYQLSLRSEPADPDELRVVLRNSQLTGEFSGDTAAFTFTATARVASTNHARLRVVSGGAALTSPGEVPGYQVRFENGGYWLVFDRTGEFPVKLEFHAAVARADGWKSLDFKIAPSVLQRMTLHGLAADTQFQFTGAARPERTGKEFVSFLPPDGAVKLRWQETRPEAEGKLFYSAEMLSQIRVSPGLMRQEAALDFKVMQGELSRVTLRLRGAGEITRVSGDQVLAWNVETIPGSSDRRLTVQFNQPQKDHAEVQVQTQSPLGAFPQTADVLEIQPESATRFAGYFRIVNDGAVRLEVLKASGLSQVSPEQFPQTSVTKGFPPGSGQRFAYRFSGAEFSLRLQADQILPEVAVSQVLAYRLGENDLAIDAEIELDIREAPLRELIVRVPKGFAVAQLSAAGMADYFLRDSADDNDAELRLVFGQPVSGRQVIGLRLERNSALGAAEWQLPRIEVAKTKSVRGNVGVTADAGFRLTPSRTVGLSEIATAFFPRKVAGLQSAFRISEPNWEATMAIERLPQTVQADVFHLFSIGEGIAYGSSVMNYVVSGAPVSVFRVELSDEYFNVEFTGAEVRNWQKTTNGWLVQLHAPVSGTYTLLATYERPFKPQGETLAFTGARPLDAQTEQGHTLVISTYQFQVKPAEVSPGLLALETGEVPPEYRLFFDAPILAAYRYTSRPFNLRLALSPLAQGESLNQVVDRASLVTRISKEGQVITDATYFVKSRGNPNFRIVLPEGVQLWSATVNGAPVVPVTDAKENLIRLPQQADPNALLRVELKLASRSPAPTRVAVAVPRVVAPVMLAEWKLTPDEGQRLDFRNGTLAPVGGVPDASGFAALSVLFSGVRALSALTSLFTAAFLLGLGLLVWRLTPGADVYRFGARHVCGIIVGGAAMILGLIALMAFGSLAPHQQTSPDSALTFLAPVQQAGSALSVEVANVDAASARVSAWSYLWPVAVALIVWVFGIIREHRWCAPLGWTVLAWSALRAPNGLPAFALVITAFVVIHVALPALRALWKLPRRPEAPSDIGGKAGAAVSLLIGGLVLFGTAGSTKAAERTIIPVANDSAPLAESVIQSLRVEDKFVIATAKVRWQAEEGKLLPLINDPAVVTRAVFPTNSLRLVRSTGTARSGQQLLALKSGTFTIELDYQMPVDSRSGALGVLLPTRHGLVNQVELTLVGLDVDVISKDAVTVQRETRGTNTVASLVLMPASDPWISWKPRSRDVTREQAVFYAEWSQLYVPSAGVIEGLHHVQIRPARGELSELVFRIPSGATITDVANVDVAGKAASAPPVWRFDPDSRKLRVTLRPAVSGPFGLIIRSQVATGPLPFEQSVGLVSVEGAAGQIGLLGIGTGNEVQLDAVSAGEFVAINLEDFPATAAQRLQAQIAGLTVRRAFRYSDVAATAKLSATAVQPDVRVDGQQTISLSEDRTVLAANLAVSITRAGIFRLSFAMPDGYDVEAVSGAALSHWTELKTDAGRIITLHLRGKTEGQQQFSISLAGPGTKAAPDWSVPQLSFREASKDQGTVVIVPEQGMQVQAAAMTSLSQLDPQRSGIRQKGVLAFRILQSAWTLALRIEQVDPWVQVTSLQHATVNEAQVKVGVNLQYQIENAGLKSLFVLVATNAENVRFAGDLVADFVPVAGAITNGLQRWEVKLQRRVIGALMIQATYQTPVAENASETRLVGVQAAGVNLQRGFVTVQSSGRLQLRVEPPAALQTTEWQGIPRALQQNLPANAANFAFRLVESAFELPLKLERHEAAKLLAARVNHVMFTSVISDDGVMLTQARLDMLPGDKRLLHFTLPKGAEFWFAFVNQNGVWPWREGDRVLIPLEPQARNGETMPVEIFYTSKVGEASRGKLDLDLFAPQFDLPLEDITWRVFLSDKWDVSKWSGALQLQQEQIARSGALDLQSYLRSEADWQRGKTQQAEQMLSLGNRLLEKGDPQQARRAFQSAYGLSQGDMAFNEDARVQLNNLKLQQALVGLNVRQSVVANESDALAQKLRDLRGREDNGYSQGDAKAIIDRNPAEVNNAYMKLAQRLIQQQDAAVANPAVIRAAIPEQGRLLTFKRAVLVDTWADLNLALEAKAAHTVSWGGRVVALLGVFATLALLGWVARIGIAPKR